MHYILCTGLSAIRFTPRLPSFGLSSTSSAPFSTAGASNMLEIRDNHPYIAPESFSSAHLRLRCFRGVLTPAAISGGISPRLSPAPPGAAAPGAGGPGAGGPGAGGPGGGGPPAAVFTLWSFFHFICSIFEPFRISSGMSGNSAAAAPAEISQAICQEIFREIKLRWGANFMVSHPAGAGGPAGATAAAPGFALCSLFHFIWSIFEPFLISSGMSGNS